MVEVLFVGQYIDLCTFEEFADFLVYEHDLDRLEHAFLMQICHEIDGYK